MKRVIPHEYGVYEIKTFIDEEAVDYYHVRAWLTMDNIGSSALGQGDSPQASLQSYITQFDDWIVFLDKRKWLTDGTKTENHEIFEEERSRIWGLFKWQN